ncbi:hypothetical protein C453_12726 [Haloferax elongans ATCC BAA-1513]|uniref:Uncharacterized protein n=1 Tax=Haloferax elongans ATCC BAA-1513 TaxID=1230453 RepID=M0HIN1_HALEO|nr:hypothetical protein [Haloferax elongans]ELZ84410.1 hypothetical protein C453_12726 [Haloferax elongans ATCC BAA-1513]
MSYEPPTASGEEWPPNNPYQRDGWDWLCGGADDIAERITDRLAVLPDGIFVRVTPPEQPTVADIVTPGTLIETAYGDIQKVFAVREREYYGIPAWSFALGDPSTPAREDGMPKRYQGRNVKYLVQQDGEIRSLFWHNDDVVEIHGYDEIDVDYQSSLSAGWAT